MVVGQEQMTATALAAVSLGGHVLLEGPPGVAKTLLAAALSRALGLDFRRIQFTPDMLPSDVTGNVALRGGELVFRRGPVFTNVLLADEINRTPPKTQAALLEAMQERQVSVEGRPEPLPDPFLVLATQNPIEYEGTYALPEAQLDRFLVRLDVELPGRGRGAGDAGAPAAGRRARRPRRRAAGGRRSTRCARRATAVDATRVDDEVARYVIAVVRRTRELPSVQLGASPRAAVHLLGAAKAAARLAGRDYVTPDDVGGMARRRAGAPARAHPGGRARALPRRRRGPDGARRGARPAMSVAPRAAAVLAAIAVLTALTSPAVGAASRRCCWPEPCWPTRSACAAGPRSSVASARTSRAGCPRRCACETEAERVRMRQPAPRRARHRAARGRRPAGGDGHAAAPRPPHAAAGRAAQRGAARPRPLAPRGRGRAGGHGLPRRAGRAPARAGRPPGPLPLRRPAHARAARARHRVRVGPRLRARRRHPPGQLARHRAHAAPDEQPVPGRAGP